MTENDNKEKEEREEEVILLEDLKPKKDVKGGASKFLFGQTKEQNGGKQKGSAERKKK